MSLLNVEVDDSILSDFRRFAVGKHGKIYGVLRPEVEAALEQYMRTEKSLSEERKRS